MWHVGIIGHSGSSVHSEHDGASDVPYSRTPSSNGISAICFTAYSSHMKRRAIGDDATSSKYSASWLWNTAATG
jgi:hypothetical protein